MSKKSILAREQKRKKLMLRFAEKRAACKKIGDWAALDQLPKNSSPVRRRNRCKITGRPRGYLRRFGLSRILFRELASQGYIPGLSKVSW